VANKDVAKLAVSGPVKCFRTTENVKLKMEKKLLIWISDQRAKGGRRQRIFMFIYLFVLSHFFICLTFKEPVDGYRGCTVVYFAVLK
jgi:hypothetical protein